MKLKNYTMSLFAGALCFTGYFIFHSHHEYNIFDNVIVQTLSTGRQLQDELEAPILDGVQNNNEVAQSSMAPYNTPEPVGFDQHVFRELPIKNFVTIQERRNLFADLGIEYIDIESFDYVPGLSIDARATQKYIDNSEYYDDLSRRYQDDVASKTLVPMSLRWLGAEIGHGVFAESDLREGDFVGIYTGSIQARSLLESKDYAWFYPIVTELGEPVSLDARLKGNELRFINDGITPNCIVKYIIGKDNHWHVCYIASMDIKKGEQLLVSYGPAYWETRKYKYQELADQQ